MNLEFIEKLTKNNNLELISLNCNCSCKFKM